MKRSGFTMIELIFVIVILGILAAVAIPRLAATRDDAKISKVATDISTLVSDVSAYYTGSGSMAQWGNMSNVKVYADATLATDANESNTTAAVYMGDTSTGTACFSITRTANSDGIAVANVGTPAAGSVCNGAQTAAAALVKTHQFGGNKVNY
jgi:prepilin-type N-terminal cleavage/methylation domain-containing protein